MTERDPYYLPLEPQSEAGRRAQEERGKKKGRHPWDDAPEGDKPAPIPTAPSRDIELVPGRVRGGISDRARAAANLKVDGFSYQEIADMLEFKSAKEAKAEVERVLAQTHSPDDYETLRILATSRAEERLRRSVQMANADYLVVRDPDGNETKVPNEKKLQWHQQSAIDLMNWATITGAKAPAKMEISPDLEMLDTIVSRLAIAAGHQEILDAEVIDLDVVPPGPAPDFDEVDDEDEP